jgi:hypothetical protein
LHKKGDLNPKGGGTITLKSPAFEENTGKTIYKKHFYLELEPKRVQAVR